jgi:hypothetical protein
MTSYQPFELSKPVHLGGSRAIRALGSETAELPVLKNGRPTTVTLRNTPYVPELRNNLISMSQLTDQRFGIGIKPEAITIRQSRREISDERRNGLYVITASECPEANVARVKKSICLKEAQVAFAPLNVEALRKMLLDHGYNVISDIVPCTDWIKRKQHRTSYRPKPDTSRTTKPGIIHRDLCQVNVESFGRSMYFRTMRDGHSLYRKTYLLKSKNETPDCV